MVDGQGQEGDVAEFKDNLPTKLQDSQIVVKEGNVGGDEVQSNDCANGYQGLLSDEAPGGVADAHKDWLVNVLAMAVIDVD